MHHAGPDDSTGRERVLAAWLAERGSVLVGYSGGVDSTYLAAVALDVLGAGSTLAVIGRSASYPESQWASARDVAARIGLTVREIGSRLVPLARELGIAAVVDGTNADDLTGHRPGMAAAREWGVESPLAVVGLGKQEIRALSAARGLPTWDQPSSPCLSSRLPTGTEVTPLRLARVEAAERAARAIGVQGDLRVRYHGDTARVELTEPEVERWRSATHRSELHDAIVSAGFASVELDLRGFRSGKANDAADASTIDVLGA